MHNGTVMQAGEKMSKSIGNIVTLASIAAEHDPRAYRVVVLQSHYRAPSELGSGNLEAAEEALRRVDALDDGLMRRPAWRPWATPASK